MEEGEQEIFQALDRQEFVLYYQPQIDLKSGNIIGVEALIRWDHPKYGLVLPEAFIPLAEQSGAIISLGEWVLRTACLQNKRWQLDGYPPIVVSVNISALQFLQSDLVQTAKVALEESGLEPQYLELEITESMAMDVERTSDTLNQLKQLGIKICMDDFGTGYSSLHYLKRFPIDKLKIDRSFVQECTIDRNDATIVKTIIEMAHNLRVQVVAEGVETKEHLVFLQQNLCDAVQGFFFSKPIMPDQLAIQFGRMEKVIASTGIHSDELERLWLRAEITQVRHELLQTLRMQQGMTFKFRKQGERFIHTMCDGELMYRTGLVPEQIVGKELADFLPLSECSNKMQYYERAWSGEENVTYEGYSNGIYYLAALRPIVQGGQVVEVIASCVDITERKKAEEELRRSEAMFRLIAEHMSDILAVLDRQGMIQYVSPSVKTNLGTAPEELEGRHLLSVVSKEQRQKVKQAFAEILEGKQPRQVHISCVHPNGTKIILEAKGTPVIQENRDVTQVVVLVRNITAQLQAEEFLRKMDKISVVGHLVAGVAHEIRNPVTSIKGFVQLLKHDHGKQEYFDIMQEEFQQLENILREFVALTQHRTNHFEWEEIVTILRGVSSCLMEKTAIHKMELDLPEEKTLQIWCDQGQIRQVFTNLLSNAMESMPDGGTIRIQVRPEDPDKVMVRIVDEGCGMCDERIKRLGEPFYSTKEKGTGLGLMISYKIIAYHQGSIHFSSVPGKGTTVEVYLPTKKAHSR